MKKQTIKKIGIMLMFSIFCFILTSTANAADSNLEVKGLNIMPKLNSDQVSKINTAIDEIGKKGGEVMWKYYEESKKLKTDEQVAGGIMNWDTIMNYLVFIVQFLSQLGLVVGALFIMVAGYKYIVSLFNGGRVPSSTVKNAIIGILIVIFSYAIMKILTSFIGLS